MTRDIHCLPAGYLEARSIPEPNSGCWLWINYVDAGGYGQATVGGSQITASRLAYEIAYGPFPDGLHVLHKCDVRSCVNPKHLFLGTNADNCLDACLKGRRAYKLSEADIHAIRLSKEPMRKIAPRYGVNWTTIQKIRNRETWKHLP